MNWYGKGKDKYKRSSVEVTKKNILRMLLLVRAVGLRKELRNSLQFYNVVFLYTLSPSV